MATERSGLSAVTGVGFLFCFFLLLFFSFLLFCFSFLSVLFRAVGFGVWRIYEGF